MGHKIITAPEGDEALDRKVSEWQTVPYRCLDCGHQGECRCWIGEYAFCGKCGSEFLVKPKDRK